MKIPKDFEQRQKNLIKYNNITKRKSYYHKPDEIETRNIKIKKSQTKLNLIKENSIKDIIYSVKPKGCLLSGNAVNKIRQPVRHKGDERHDHQNDEQRD